MDIGGHPPIPFGPTTSILSVFQLQHNLLFLAGFWVLHSRSHFGDLMIQVDIGGHPPSPFEPPPSVISICKFQHNLLFIAVFRVLNFWSRFEALKEDRMSKLRPREVETPIYPNGAHSSSASSPRVRILDV